jgi:hypothetical protein
LLDGFEWLADKQKYVITCDAESAANIELTCDDMDIDVSAVLNIIQNGPKITVKLVFPKIDILPKWEIVKQ